MVAEELRMRLEIEPTRHAYAPVGVEKPPHSVRQPILGNEQAIIFVDRNEATIKDPVNRTRQCQPIADRIGASMSDWSYVRRLNLGAPATVDNLQTRHRTGVGVGGFYSSRKGTERSNSR